MSRETPIDLEQERDAVLENAEALDIMALSDHCNRRFPGQSPMSCVALLMLADREAEETP